MEPSQTNKEVSRRELIRQLKRAPQAMVESPRAPRQRQTPAGWARAMRTGEGRRMSKNLPDTPAPAIVALNRMGFGPRSGDIAEFNGLGETPAERIQAHVYRQLHPWTVDDSACNARISAAGFSTINKSRQQLWADHVESGVGWSERMRPFFEVERLTFLRAVHSRRQLVEVLADFWHNHFNVYGYDYYCGPMWVHYDRDVIRGNLLGNFRHMLEDVARSTCMLYYLDNYTSSNAGPNENWARELFELHTLGAENYLGVRRQADVPLDGQGRPVGYVDDDVFEATRCFTGWSFDWDTGLFDYRGDWHDHFQKSILGTYIPPNQAAEKDGLDVLDAVAYHPGTARHISRKLCQRFISDDPPQNAVDAAAAVFEAAKYDGSQLLQVVNTILMSSEFLDTWGEKIKRPFDVAVNAMRAADAQFTFELGESEFDSFLWRYDQAGQPLFSWRAPDGYPDHKEDWQSAAPRVMLWRLCNWLLDVEDDDDQHLLDVVGQTPSWIRSARGMADFWIDRALGQAMPLSERDEIVAFMAQGHNPDYDLPVDSDRYTRERLRAMVALIFMSPSFLWR
jgi:uncharacterized protein (DUF1800 family)